MKRTTAKTITTPTALPGERNRGRARERAGRRELARGERGEARGAAELEHDRRDGRGAVRGEVRAEAPLVVPERRGRRGRT